MNAAELLAAFRSELDDLQEPYLWSDAQVYGYLSEAQTEFCRQTEGIEDALTPAVCRLQIVPGRPWVAKSPLIRKLRAAWRTDSGRAVDILTPENAARQGWTGNGPPGPLRALIDGQSRGQLRVWPLPSETVTVALAVFRLPLEDITGRGDELEIGQEHHPALLLWMKYRAYSKHDPQTCDSRRAGQYRDDFRACCADARAEQGRIRRQSGTVAYGGI